MKFNSRMALMSMLVLFILSVSGIATAQSIKPLLFSGAKSGQGNSAAPHAAKALGELLYSQTGTPFAAIVSQNFETENDAKDAQAADDFIVPVEGWTIGGIIADGQVASQTQLPDGLTVNVWFYTDSSDLPGTAVCSYDAIPIVDTTDVDLTIELPTSCELSAGHYWVSVQINLDSTDFWGWDVIAAVANHGAAFQNPGDGLESGCTVWTDLGTCAGTEPIDVIFALYAPLTQNLVDNGGFEANDGTRSNGTRAAVLEPWVLKNGTGEKIKINTETKTVAHEGVAAFQFKGGVGESSKIQQIPDITGLTFNTGDTFAGSLFVNASKATAAGKVKIVVTYSDADSSKAVTTLGQTGGYEEVVLNTINAASANVTKVKVQIKHSSPSGKVYVDDVVLNWTPAAAANAAQPGLIPLP
ncbi:MAG TPA: hypothetical protein VHL11_03355 [Phototrophicaceae bacterium]|jgi:hypothetical protein|nr:hypothetical protein [Phototrophicaceae bacterium]